MKELLAVLESRRMLTQCTALDCSATTSMTLQYGIYRLKLPRGGDYDYYMRLAEGALAKGLEEGVLLEGQSGVLDLTVAEGKARFRADQ